MPRRVASVAEDDAVARHIGPADRAGNEVVDIKLPALCRLAAVTACAAIARVDDAAHLLPVGFLLRRSR